MFTFVFPLLIVVIFGALVQTRPGGGGLFTESPNWYVPGYLAVVVLFTPLSRVGSEVARHRDGNRFEKLATTPLTRWEWLTGQTLVNVGVIGLAAVLVLLAMVGLTGAEIPVDAATALWLALYVAVGVTVFCAVGALLGSLADSQDGVIAASNTVALPTLFLSETFVPTRLLPDWLPTRLSPLTYFADGVRAVVTDAPGQAVGPLGPELWNLLALAGWAAAFLVIGGAALPRTD